MFDEVLVKIIFFLSGSGVTPLPPLSGPTTKKINFFLCVSSNIFSFFKTVRVTSAWVHARTMKEFTCVKENDGPSFAPQKSQQMSLQNLGCLFLDK